MVGELLLQSQEGGGIRSRLQSYLTAELMDVHKAPYRGAFTPYTEGLDGWVPMLQAVLAF
jgi:hypothetical protein